MSKHINMVLKATTVITGAYLLIANDSQALEGWNLQLEPMYLEMGGANTHQSTVKTTMANSQFSELPISETKNFHYDGNVTFRGQLEYKPSDWGIGLSGWWFDAQDSLSQNILSPKVSGYVDSNGNNAFTSVSTQVNSRVFSLSVPARSSGGLVRASANSNISVWNLDAYAIKTLGDFDNGQINLTFGVKIGGITNTGGESYSGTPMTYDYGNFNFTENSIGTASYSAKANIMAGPSIGIQGHGKHENHRLEGLISQSVLIGNLNRDVFASYENSTQFAFNYYGQSYQYGYSIPEVVNRSNSETIAIPVTDIKLKYAYDVTENLSLGLGVFASIWVDTPAYPRVQISNEKYNTLVFYGGLSSISLKF
ncbi:MAG: hypothetical protein NTX45_16695 [Proteobacteria bacterium]|nr:hypothetical protein [Pseudomonadota bacterium]